MKYYALRKQQVVESTLSAFAIVPVNKTRIGGIEISTVFVGMDLGLAPGGKPLVFETAVITSDDNVIYGRCSTWEQAQGMHRAAVEDVKAGRERYP
jgi:hypothetical protein